MLRLQRFLSLSLALLLLAAPAGPLCAQGKNKAKDAKQAATAQPLPDDVSLNILIRRTLLTLNDANLSGNYTVLRDLASPDFQTANKPEKLASIFAKLRKTKVDMAPIVYFDPKLVRKPQITKSGMLRLTGFMPTKPQQVNFDMLFQNVSGRWRLFGIAINTTLTEAKAGSPGSAGASKAKAKAKKKSKK